MPLLVEVTGALRDVMAVHDVQDLITDALSIARPLAYHAHDLAEQVSTAQDLLAVVDAKRILILRRDLLGEADLRVLQLPRLRVVPLLPGQLPDEAVAEPDKDHAGVVDVSQIDLVADHVPAPEVTMHQRP